MAHDENLNQPDLENQFSGEEDFASMLDANSHLAPPAEGEVLQGHVVSVSGKDVIVDFGYNV